ncbi:hypothetical protein T439DRAFT_379300 [Meredithblackwellia eburnea MCA 4105]
MEHNPIQMTSQQHQQHQATPSTSNSTTRDVDAIPARTLTSEESHAFFQLANEKRGSSNHVPSSNNRNGNSVVVEEPEQIDEPEGQYAAPAMEKANTPRPSLFNLAHSRHSTHDKLKEGDNHVHGFSHPLSFRHLFKPPVVRQWLAGGVLARETAERESARFELFFDLAFVGIIHQLAEGASESESSWAIFKFIAFFYVAYSVWTDTRSFINTSGTDDVPQRIYVLLVMVLLMGYSSNASAIKIECPTSESSDHPAVRLLKRAVKEASPSSSETHEALSDAVMLPGGCELLAGWRKSVRAAVAFYLSAKLLRISQCLLYGWYLPRFRPAHIVRAWSILIGCCFYIPLLTDLPPRFYLILPIVAIALEVSAAYTVALSIKAVARARATWLPKLVAWIPMKRAAPEHGKGMASFTPALNLEHIIERNALFVVLVLGEMVLNVTFEALGTQSGIHTEYLRCVLGLVIAYCLNWEYSDHDSSRTYLHAIRRHWFTSITWSILHFPLTASLILASAALPKLISSSEPNQRIRWYFGGGLSCAMLTLATLGFLHKGLDRRGSAIVPHYLRLLVRLTVSAGFAVLPLARGLSSTALLGIYSGVLVTVVATETFGKIGAVGDEEKVKQALSSRRHDEEEEKHEDGMHPEYLIHLDEAALKEEHEHGLTPEEAGEGDVGVEGDLGQIRVTRLGRAQRLAYAF